MKKLLKWVGLVLGAVVILLVTASMVMIGPRDLIGMIRYDQREEGALAVGHQAPDVELIALDGATPQRLHQWVGGKPLVLVFGSFT